MNSFTFSILGPFTDSVWCGLWFIVEGHNETCRSSDLIVIWCCLINNNATFLSLIVNLSSAVAAIVDACLGTIPPNLGTELALQFQQENFQSLVSIGSILN